MINSKKNQRKRERFIRIHSRIEGTYNGNFFICIKQVDGTLKNVCYKDAEKLEKTVAALKFHRNYDYYLSANSFTTGKRDLEHLFAYNNIVMDIDLHLGNSVSRKREIGKLEYFLLEEYFKFGKILPIPNTIVYTGRGIQLWWSLVQTSAAFDWMYDYVIHYFADCLEIFLGDYEIHGIVDRSASTNHAGLFRMPVTFNTSSNSCGRIEILHENQISMQELYEEIKHQGRKRKYKNEDIWSEKDYKIGMFRYQALIKLIEYRKEQGREIGAELRDLFLFCSCASLCHVMEKEKLLLLLEEMNMHFLSPMPCHEWQSYMSTCLRKKYKIHGNTIIKYLDISKEEQAVIGMYEYIPGLGREVERLRKRDMKKKRNQEIIRLCENGYNKSEIARQLKCSPSTVASVLSAEKIMTVLEKKKEEMKNIVREKGVQSAIEQGISRTTAYRIRKILNDNRINSDSGNQMGLKNRMIFIKKLIGETYKEIQDILLNVIAEQKDVIADWKEEEPFLHMLQHLVPDETFRAAITDLQGLPGT